MDPEVRWRYGVLTHPPILSGKSGGRSGAPQKMKFDLLAGAFALQRADEWQRPAAHSEMPAIVLDPADFVEGVFVEE